MVDDFTREALALVVDSSIPGARVVRELEALIAWQGAPPMIVSDNGSETTSRACSTGRTEPASTGVRHGPRTDGGHTANHRTWQAATECLRRELQRPIPG